MKVAVGLRRVAAGKRTSGRRAAQIAIENRGECRDSIHLVSLYELEEENYTNEEILVWNKVSTEEVRLKRFLKRSVNFLYRQKGLIMNLSDRCDYRRNWIKYIINCFVLFFI